MQPGAAGHVGAGHEDEQGGRGSAVQSQCSSQAVGVPTQPIIHSVTSVDQMRPSSGWS